MIRWSLIAAAALLAACASTGAAPSTGAPAARDSAMTQVGTLPPEGFGTLRQEDIAVDVALEGARVRVLSLDERLLRLLTTDSYHALHDLRAAHDSAIADAVRAYHLSEPAVWLVTYFGTAAEARYDAADVRIVVAGREIPASAIVPITAGFSAGRVVARETQSALYVFDGVDPLHPLAITIAGRPASDWDAVLRRAERELALVRSRSGVRP